MPSLLTISNTSPLFYLHQVGQLEVLPKLYGTVIVPAAVDRELEAGKTQGVDVPNINNLDWLEIRSVESESTIPNVVNLGRGEAEVIALGIETQNSLLILDDSLGRDIAAQYQLRYTGTLGILIKAKQTGYLEAVTPIVAQLQDRGMWLTDSVIQAVLQLAQEI